jgi:NADH-quinone oxidoreductase subunit N
MKPMLFAPELWLLFGGLLLFGISLGRASGPKARITALGVAVVALAFSLASVGQKGELFFAVYRIDFFSQVFKVIITAGLCAVLLFTGRMKDIREEVLPEYYLFLLLSTLGLVMLVSSVELLTIFIALELSSYSLYLLVPMRREQKGLRIQMESAAKYILFGVVATGVMLFGMSYLFGLTGTTYLSMLLPRLQPLATQPAALAGIAMVMGGFFFKLGVFPFHFWIPDVYQGAANETTAFIATLPKVGAVALLIRVVNLIAPHGGAVATLLMVLAIGSMFYGNLIALVQKDIKRLLGFSGIAHAGYVLLGLITLKDAGFATAMYYITGYLLMIMACFLVICKVSPDGENVTIDDLSGLYQRAPFLALVLGVAMFALAGIPPFVGFMGKFMLLTGALREGYLALVILAAINTAISIYYYLSVVRVTYTVDPGDRPFVPVDAATGAIGIVLVAAIVYMGVAPARFVEMASQAMHTLF